MKNNMKNLKNKRYFLIFLFPPILIFIPHPIFDFTKTILYILLSCVLFSIALLINFPKILHLLHARKTTIDDLKDIRSTNKKIKNRFIRIFELSLTFMLAITIGCVIEYYLNKFNFSNLYNIEVLGVLGGIFSLIHRIEAIIGKILLAVLKKYKEREIPHITDSHSVVELTEFKKLEFPIDIELP